MTSKDGFSVVAPIRVTVPSSTTGRIASCSALLNRWISSMNRIVLCPIFLRSSRLLDDLSQIGNAGRNRAHTRELGTGNARDDFSERGFAHAGRPPENDGPEAAVFNRPSSAPPPDPPNEAGQRTRRKCAGASVPRGGPMCPESSPRFRSAEKVLLHALPDYVRTKMGGEISPPIKDVPAVRRISSGCSAESG